MDITYDTAYISTICCCYSSCKLVVLDVSLTVWPALYDTRLCSKDTTYIILTGNSSGCITVLDSYCRCIRCTVQTKIGSAITAAGNTACIVSACLNSSVEDTVLKAVRSHSLALITADTTYIIHTVNGCMAYAVQHISVVLTAKGTNV